MTASAKFADILLPSVTPLNRTTLSSRAIRWTRVPCLLPKAIEPLFEARSGDDICAALSEKIVKPWAGLIWLKNTPEGRSQLECKHLTPRPEPKPELPESFDEASKVGLFKWFPCRKRCTRIFVKIRSQPSKTPLQIEIFSKRLWDLNQTWELPKGVGVITPYPYEKHGRSLDDAEGSKKHPFQLIGHHYKGRVHSFTPTSPGLSSGYPAAVG